MKRLYFAILSAALSCVMASPNLAAVCSQPQLFQPATSTPLGARPNRVVLADLNHDGILDAVLPMRDTDSYVAGNSIAVMLGSGVSGAIFGPPTFYVAGGGPQGIAVADFDADGNLDLAVSNGTTNNISILPGGGDGTFGGPNNIPCGVMPYGIVAEDLNHDGIVDLAVANNGAASVSVLIGLGGGAFAAPTSYPVADLSVSIAVADVDRDGKSDLIATAYNQGVAVLLGIGDGTFRPAQQYATGGQPYSLALADVDGDGILDLLAGNQGYGGLAVLKGTGTGTFGAPNAVYGAGAWSVAGIVVGDVDGDGIADVLLTNATGNAVIVLKGQGSGGTGDGTFAVHSTYPAASFPVGIAMGQLDGDGLPDVVVAGYGSSAALTMLGSCSTPPPPPEAPHLTSVRDVPNDNGGLVFVTWTASSLDISGGSVIQYRVWRRIPAQTALARGAGGAGGPLMARTVGTDGATVVYWEALATLPAQRLQGYGYTAPTTQDSMRFSNPYTAFFVSALTADIDVFYSSNIDSGYSVDNIAPHRPNGFVADRSNAGVSLHWEINDESDFAAYGLYRGATADFVPSDGNQIATPADTGYVDAGALGDQYYKLAAIDVHGNKSEFAVAPPLGVLGVGDVATAVFELRGAVPNPSRTGMLSIHLSLPGGSGGRLEVLDLAGRRVTSRALSGFAPGPHVVTLGERGPLPTGVYLIRLVMGERRKDVKAIVMR